MSTKLWREHYNQAFGTIVEASNSKGKKKFPLIDSNANSGRNVGAYNGTSSSNVDQNPSGESRSREIREEQNTNDNSHSKSIKGRKGLTVNAVNLRTGLPVKTYSSITAAATASDLTYYQISRCCQGLIPEAGGFGWKHAFGWQRVSGKNNELLIILKILISYLQ
jgi:hypothetical protein